ncbi:MAG TPA: amino acid permease, partial [Luteimonas sp.]|nr:amino acid permease [Luteimonas sp.]
ELLTAGAVIAKYWGIYLAMVFELLDIHIPTTIDVLGIGVDWGPLFIVGVFTALLIMGTKISARVNNVFTILKVGIVVFVIVVGLTYFNADNLTPFVPPSVPTEGGSADVWSQSLFSWMTGAEPARYGIAGVLSGAALVFFAFIGFDVVATSAEEVKNPQRTLPLGIFGGLALVTLLYIGVAFALTGMVPYTLLAEAENPSLATAFVAVGAGWAAQVISLGILVGLTTVIMVLLMGLSRVLLAMSRDGLLPRWLSVTSETRKTPVRLQLITGAAVALLAGFTQVEILEEMINIGTLSAFVLVSIAVVVLRRKRPDLPRAYRVPFSPVLPIVSALLCFYLMLNLTTLTWVRFAVWLLIGAAIYFAYGRRHARVGQPRETGQAETP